MILDGRMPSPEEAHQQLRQRLERQHLGEPMKLMQDTTKIKTIMKVE
jgi:hypothetical protein